MIYYTSDLHFGHQNILKYEPRPWSNLDEMDKGLIERWNSKVKDEDEVWILGDLTFYKDQKKNIELISQLKGHKHLIIGNHDSYLKEKYLNKYFESIQHYKRIKDKDRDVILCHYPIYSWDKMKYGSYHLYGHVHGDPEWQLNKPNSFNVGVDVNNWYPVTLDELISDNSIDSAKFFEELGKTNLLGPEYPLPPEFYTWKELRKQSNYKDFLKLLISNFSYYNRPQEKFLCFIQQDWKDIYPTRLEIDVIRKLANNKEEIYLALDAADILEALCEHYN